jgi:hypothetical protein
MTCSISSKSANALYGYLDQNAQETLAPQPFWVEFPTRNNRETIFENRDFLSDNRENLRDLDG